MEKVYNCPFCGGSVVGESKVYEGLFACGNQGCKKMFLLFDASSIEIDRIVENVLLIAIRLLNMKKKK